MYAGVVGLEERDFDAFVLEVALALGEVEGGMVRGSVPVGISPALTSLTWGVLDRPVGQEGNLVSRHNGLFTRVQATKVSTPEAWGGDQEAASPFAGIIQIKFKRYNLRTSPSPIPRVCRDVLSVRGCRGPQTDMRDWRRA